MTGLVGLLLGVVFELDPTSPPLVGLGLHLAVAALFALGGGLLLLLSLIASWALLARNAYGRYGALGLAALYVCIGLAPLGLLVIWGLTRPDVAAAFEPPGAPRAA